MIDLKNEFILTLPSNDPTNTSGSNTNFRIHFDSSLVLEGQWVVSLLSIELTPTVLNQSIYVYTSAVDDQIIGSQYAPLLTKVPGKSSLSVGQVYRMAQPMEFKPVAKQNFSSLEIDLRTGTGTPASLNAAYPTTVSLLFKKV